MHDLAKVLAQLDGYSFIKEWYADAPPPDPASGEVAVRCPFHADGTPSLHFNTHSKLYHCKGCGASGDAFTLHAFFLKVPRPAAVAQLAATLGVFDDKAVAADRVETLHVALKLNTEARAALLARKGLDDADIQTWRLGWDADARRLVIPVRDAHGVVVNLRGYDLLKAHDPGRKYTNLKGHGEARLWPLEATATPGSEVVLTEGELKMVGLRRRGFNAITTTGGARAWADSFTPHFRGLRVVLLYDVDDTGRAQAARHATTLRAVAASVKVVGLPLDPAAHPHGDVLDYFTQGGGTAEALRALIDGTPEFVPPAAEPAVPDDPTVYPVELAHASRAAHYGKRVEVRGLVAAKDQSPFVVPRELEIRCERALDVCPACPVFKRPPTDGPFVAEWPADDAALLQLVEVDLDKQRRIIAQQLGIPASCKAHEQVVRAAHNLEELRLEPQLDAAGAYAAAGADRASVRAYFVGHGLQEGAAYSMKARAAVDPKDQHATLLGYEAAANADNLATFDPTDEELAALRLFRPAEWSVAGIDAKLDELYTDLSRNVTRIFRRPEIHLLFDLVWHSALYLPLDGEPRKGWVDAVVLGDSGHGKSETAMRLLTHYGLGEWVDMKGATAAGIKGGLKEVSGRWWTEWGVAPKNDRRALVLDEVKGAHPEVLQALTSMRSSGVAELVKIERRRAWARTRLLWVSNPRPNRGMATYTYGVLALKELMGSLEDVRRFDAALIVATGEVAQADINADLRAHVAGPAQHSAELCRRLVLWAWTRKATDIDFEPAAWERCLDRAADHAARFSATLPLVEPADHRFKLARLAAALAARTYSADDTGRRLVVRPCHVDYVADFLTQCYSTRHMGYADFSKSAKEEAQLCEVPELQAALLRGSSAGHVLRGLLNTTAIRPWDVHDWLGGGDLTGAQRLIARMVNSRALTRRGTDYYKTAEFIAWLRPLEAEHAANGPGKAPREDF